MNVNVILTVLKSALVKKYPNLKIDFYVTFMTFIYTFMYMYMFIWD